MMKMMGLPSCEDLEKFTRAYFANELDPETHQKFEAHMAHCISCKQFVDSYRRTMHMGEYFQPPPMDPEFKGMLVDFLQQRSK